MKISVQTKQLVDASAKAARVASTKLEALSGIMIDASDEGCEIQASDQELTIALPLEAQTHPAGQALVPAKLLADVARQLPGDSVDLELVGNELTVQSGKASFTLRVLRADDFPAMPDPMQGSGITLPAAEFFDSVTRVSRSASKDETRPILTGVLVSAEADQLQMVATDSYRLALKKTALPAAVQNDFEAIIPARALNELAKLADKEEEISLVLQDRRAVFMVADTVFSTSLLAGSFPDFRQLIPSEFEHQLKMETQQLLETAKRVSLLSKQNAPLKMSFADNTLSMICQTPEVGEAKEELDAPYKGEPMEIGFAPEYLISGLEAVGCEQLSMKLISPTRPAVLASEDGSGLLYLLMPVRLSV